MKNQSITSFVIKTSLSLMIATTSLTSSATVMLNSNTDMIPTGKGWGIKSNVHHAITTNFAVPQNGIYYHNGYVMATTTTTIPTVYFVWYGNWTGNVANSAINILSNLARGIGASPYYRINTTYQNNNNTVIPKVNFGCSTYNNYTYGTSLSDSSIYYIIRDAIAAGKLPSDPNGIYFVMTSPDVKETSGFCTSYCGWHSASSLNGKTLLYSFIGNASTQCPGGCEAQQSTSPNNNPGADGMASVFAHELEETVTDPNFSGWYDNNSNENADKCAWNFGATQTDVNGARYNMTINKMNYLIQQNWLNANGGGCAKSY